MSDQEIPKALTFEEWLKAWRDTPEAMMTQTCEEWAWAAWAAAKGGR